MNSPDVPLWANTCRTMHNAAQTPSGGGTPDAGEAGGCRGQRLQAGTLLLATAGQGARGGLLRACSPRCTARLTAAAPGGRGTATAACSVQPGGSCHMGPGHIPRAVQGAAGPAFILINWTYRELRFARKSKKQRHNTKTKLILIS